MAKQLHRRSQLHALCDIYTACPRARDSSRNICIPITLHYSSWYVQRSQMGLFGHPSPLRRFLGILISLPRMDQVSRVFYVRVHPLETHEGQAEGKAERGADHAQRV